MIKPRAALLSVLLLLLLAPVCGAQLRGGTVELNPFGGYLFGGSFPAGSTNLFTNKVDIEDHSTWGGRIGWNITGKFEAEAQFSRTETHFVSPGNDAVFGSAGTRLGDLTIDYALGFMTFHFGRSSRVVPYATLGMGGGGRARQGPGGGPGEPGRGTGLPGSAAGAKQSLP